MNCAALALLAGLAATPTPGVDLACEHVGPCVVWVASTPAGVAFLKSRPERFRSAVVEVRGGREVPAGRAEYDPATRSLPTPPPLQTELLREAAAAGLAVSPP